MTTNLIYLAGPIDAVPESLAGAWRDTAAKWFNENGFSVYNPFSAYRLNLPSSKVTARAVTAINVTALHVSSGLFINMLPGPSIGSIRELEMASLNNIPVVVVIQDADKYLSLWDVETAPSLEAGMQKMVELLTAAQVPHEISEYEGGR